VVDEEARRATRIKRLLQHYVHLREAGRLGQAREVWVALRHKTAGDSVWQHHLELVSNLQEVRLLVELAKKNEDEHIERCRQKRADKWRAWVAETFENNKSRLYEYVRRGPKAQQAEPCRTTEDGKWVAGQQGRVDEAARAWGKMWVGPAPDLDALKDLYHEMRQLPTFGGRRVIAAAFLLRRPLGSPLGSSQGMMGFGLMTCGTGRCRSGSWWQSSLAVWKNKASGRSSCGWQRFALTPKEGQEPH
jgi:hypothetical protein